MPVGGFAKSFCLRLSPKKNRFFLDGFRVRDIKEFREFEKMSGDP